ncbi:MAG: CheR family methyltransferase [Pirellulales bacterium]
MSEVTNPSSSRILVQVLGVQRFVHDDLNFDRLVGLIEAISSHQEVITFIVGPGPELIEKLSTKFPIASRVRLSTIPDIRSMPENSLYIVEPNETESNDPPDSTPGVQTPIDQLMRLVATESQIHRLGILLQSTDTDGIHGLKALGESGGFTILESPAAEGAVDAEIAEKKSMAGAIDHFVAFEVIPTIVSSFVNHIRSGRESKSDLRRSIAESVGEIADILHQHTNHNFRNYKTTTLVRRIERRLKVNRLGSVFDYLELLRREDSEHSALFRDLLISVTAFFRDISAFESLAEFVLRPLLNNRKKPLRIWVPGCATGEEAFTLAILCDELRHELGCTCDVQIFATDIDTKALSVARQAVYPIGIEQQISPERLKKYFVKKGERFQVIRRIRENCLFSMHNLISDPPFSKLDLISCRNLLIYLGSHLQVKLLPLFHFALKPQGHLFLGPSEGLSGNSELFQEIDLKNRIWQRKLSAVDKPISPIGRTIPRHFLSDHSSANFKIEHLNQVTQRIILGEFSPEWAIVDEEFRIIAVSEEIGQFLKITGGAFDNRILSLARLGIRSGLRVTLSECLKRGRRVDHDKLSMKVRGGVQRLRLTVQPMPNLGMNSSLYMVVFQKEGPVLTPEELNDSDDLASGDTLVHQLESDLAQTRDDLEKSVFELESANEDLKSTNEELLSMNEELQTANEELETSKEELSSANTKLMQARNDLENLFQSSQLALLFLDQEQNVKGFTPSAKVIFNLIDSDIGRPLWHLTHNAIEMPELPKLDEIRNDIPEALIRTFDSRIFRRRVHPYLDRDRNLVGMVITFSDETRSILAESRARVALEAGRMGVWQWNVEAGLMTFDEYGSKLLESDMVNKPVLASAILDKFEFGDRETLIAESDRAFRSGGEFLLDCKFNNHSGTWSWIRIRGARDPVDPKFVVGVLTDVTYQKEAEGKLAASETFNRTIFESSPDCVKLLDDQGRVMSMNANGCRLMEIDHFAELQGKIWHSLWPMAARKLVENAVKSALLGEQVNFQAECPTAKGNWKWWDVAVVGIPGEDGGFHNVIAVSRDITKVKQDESIHLQALEKLKVAIEVAKVGIASIDYVADRVVCDDTAAKIMGIVPNSILTREQFHACFREADRNKIDLLSNQALHVGGDIGYFIEARLQNKSECTWVNLRKRNQYGANGQAVVGLVAIQDVSELRSIESNLREQHQRLKQILTASKAGTWDWQFERNQIIWSDESYELFGQSNDGLPRSLEQCLESILEDDHPRLIQSIQQAIDSNRANWSCEFRIKQPEVNRWLYSIGEIEYSAHGKAIRMAGINLDISAHKKLEQELTEARIEAEIAAKARGEFLANMSHEIRTPMTAILGHTEILAEQLIEPDNLQSLEVIRRNGKHLLELINNILDLSKVDAGRLEVQLAEVSPTTILADVRSLMDVRANEKDIDLSFVFDSPVPVAIRIDELRLRQILINLIGNAIKFTDKGSVRVSISFSEELNQFTIRVEDTGIGMSKAQLEQIFDPFTQADGSNSRRFEGTGLGLAISHRLAKALGGEISVSSQLGVGSVFTVRFFCPDASQERTKPDLRLESSIERLEQSSRGLAIHGRILIVDDRRDIRLLAQHMVEKSGGQVLTASNGQEALELLSSSTCPQIDLVLMDMQMPVLDGYQTVQILRQRGFSKPIIALTANAMIEDREKCLAAGCDDYTTKPLDHKKLIELIAALVSGKAGS